MTLTAPPRRSPVFHTARAAQLRASAPTVTRVTLLDGRVTAADRTARTITGLVAQWGAVGRTSVGPARFARGSITAADLRTVKLMVEHDTDRVVGYLTAAADTDDGLVATFHVPPGAAGDAVLESAAAGLRDGLSIGAEIDAAGPGADGVLEVTAASWRETSMVAIPAFHQTRVTSVAASAGQAFAHAAQSQTPPAGELAPAYPGGTRIGAGTPPATYVPQAQYRPGAMSFDQAVERITAGWRSGGGEGALRAALSDVIPPADPGQAAALFRPTWLGELWSTSYTERPLIDSISHAPLTSFTVTGFRVARPAFGVAPYTGNKTPVPSPGGYTVEVVTEKATRIAGAHDIDRAFIDLGDGSFVSSYFRYQAENYAALTESQVAAWLVAEATALPAGPTDILGALDTLARYFSTLGGARMTFVAIAPDLWGNLITLRQQDAPWLYGGSASLVGGTATVGGISMVLAPGLAAGTILAGDRRAATFYEWKNPPLAVQAQNIPNGGVDLGVFGYSATIVNNPDALVSQVVTGGTTLSAGSSAKSAK